MLKAVRREEATVFNLPGRDWFLYHGPETGAENLTIGFSVFPPGSAPEGHVHPTQEEIIYIIPESFQPVQEIEAFANCP